MTGSQLFQTMMAVIRMILSRMNDAMAAIWMTLNNEMARKRTPNELLNRQ
jgi:hypothetical protein